MENTRYICIHGHFYQPPRENPWLEDVELQDSAHPYHDWNERINEECYRQNAASRILSKDRKIIDIVNNYENISFDFGPTLLYWLEKHAPDTYQKILEADKKSCQKFSGHGSAMAQAYNHMILPLANDRDKHTQVIWGIADFEKRFHRKPEGMWLPETAANTASLEVLAEHDIKFTILAPRQAQKVRKIGGKKWKDVNEGDLDTTVPYLCKLPSGRHIVLFFYNGSVSQDVAYGGLLHSGENFAGRIMDAFPEDDSTPRLIHLATDGESFGHHHRHGDMALAYCLHQIESSRQAQITNYGEFLEKFPPEQEVQIWEDSSWSCVHGIERWKSNCGCAGDQSLSGQQQWREPLRNALDWLRDTLAGIYEKHMQAFEVDPWETRNRYIDIIHDRSSDNVQKTLAGWTNRNLDGEEKTRFLRLLEMQRNAMLMYTSCGWFFDRLSGIETVQILLYASRAMQLCRVVDGTDLQSEFKDRLEAAPCKTLYASNGKALYESYVQTAEINFDRVGAHFALSSLFEEDGQATAIYCFSADAKDFQKSEAGIQVFTISRVRIYSTITLGESEFDLVALYLGGQNLFASVRPHTDEAEYRERKDKLTAAFQRGDNNEVMRLMNVLFEGTSYSLNHLFRDERRKVLNDLLEPTWQDIESSFRRIYDYNYAIMQMIRTMNMPLPKALSTPAAFIVQQDLCTEIDAEPLNIKRLNNLVEEAQRLSLDLDIKTINFEAARRISHLMNQLIEQPEDIELLLRIEQLLSVLNRIAEEMDLQNPQNVFYSISKNIYPVILKKAEADDKNAARWVEHFRNLAQHLDLEIPE